MKTTRPAAKRLRWKDAVPVVLVRARAPLDAKTLAAVVRGWGADDSRRQAMEDVLDQCMGEMLADVARRDVKARERAWAAGALEGLRFFDAKLRELAAMPESPRR